MPEMLHQHRAGLMPSGIPPGTDLSRPLREALAAHAGVPLMYQPVIEDGNYEDFKACVFRVCSIRVAQVALEDIEHELREKGVGVQTQQRRWSYALEHQCVTNTEMRLDVPRESPLVVNNELQQFLEYLASKYDFKFNRLVVSYQRERLEMLEAARGGYADYAGNISVELELMWLYWT